jgi:hypothetical protein
MSASEFQLRAGEFRLRAGGFFACVQAESGWRKAETGCAQAEIGGRKTLRGFAQGFFTDHS